jgi:hypothetical protein
MTIDTDDLRFGSFEAGNPGGCRRHLQRLAISEKWIVPRHEGTRGSRSGHEYGADQLVQLAALAWLWDHASRMRSLLKGFIPDPVPTTDDGDFTIEGTKLHRLLTEVYNDPYYVADWERRFRRVKEAIAAKREQMERQPLPTAATGT